MDDIAEPHVSPADRSFLHGDDTLLLTRDAHRAANDYLAAARDAVRGLADEAAMWAGRRLAWVAVEVACIRALQRRAEAGHGDAFERALHRIAVGRTIAALANGIEVGPGEAVRPTDLGLDAVARRQFDTPNLTRLRHEAIAPVLLHDVVQTLRMGQRVDLGTTALARLLWPAGIEDGDPYSPAAATRSVSRACAALTIAALAADPTAAPEVGSLYQARTASLLSDDAAERDRREDSLAARLLG